MKGFVRFLNLTNCRVAAEITGGGFVVFEIRQRCALDISDVLEGNFESPGATTFRNVTKNEDFNVWIEKPRCTRVEANELLA